MKDKVILLLFIFSIISCKKMKEAELGLTLYPTDLVFNQQCSFFDIDKESDTLFKVLIKLDKPVQGYYGYGISLFGLETIDGTKPMDLSCTFVNEATEITCTLNEVSASLKNGDILTFVNHNVNGNADFICYEAEDTKQEKPKICHVVPFYFKKNVKYSKKALVLSDNLLKEQSIDMSKVGGNFMIDFLNEVDKNNLPKIYVGNTLVQCEAAEGDNPKFMLCYPKATDFDIKEQSKFYEVNMENLCGNIESTGINLELYNSEAENEALRRGELMKKNMEDNGNYIKNSGILLGLLALILL